MLIDFFFFLCTLFFVSSLFVVIFLKFFKLFLSLILPGFWPVFLKPFVIFSVCRHSSRVFLFAFFFFFEHCSRLQLQLSSFEDGVFSHPIFCRALSFERVLSSGLFNSSFCKLFCTSSLFVIFFKQLSCFRGFFGASLISRVVVSDGSFFFCSVPE